MSATSSPAGRRPGFQPVAYRFELSRHVDIAPGRRPVRSWSATC